MGKQVDVYMSVVT